MLVLVLFCTLITLLLSSIRISSTDIDTAFLNKNFTTNIRGIAILFIIVSHSILMLYHYEPFVDHTIASYEKTIYWFIALFTNIGVGLFFFLSGYGNYFSLRKQVAKNWLIRKILMLYMPVAAVLVIPYTLSFFSEIYANIFPHWYSVFQRLFLMNISLSGIYWYVKIQLILYILLFIFYKLFKKHSELFLTLAVLLYVITCAVYDIPGRWYMTVLCFPAGIWCAKYCVNIKHFLQTKIIKKAVWFIILIIPLCCCAYLYNYYTSMIFISLVASLLMIIFSVILNLNSKILTYFGERSLVLYLLHPEIFFMFRNFYAGKIDVVYCVLLALATNILLAYPLQKICNVNKFFSK